MSCSAFPSEQARLNHGEDFSRRVYPQDFLILAPALEYGYKTDSMTFTFYESMPHLNYPAKWLRSLR